MMDQIREDLWLTSFDQNAGVNSCGFLLLRPEGNVLFYKAPSEDDFSHIEELGGITHQILSHRHETDPSPDLVKKAFGARLCSDASEAPEINKECQVDVTFDPEDGALESIEVLHTPGQCLRGRARGRRCRARSVVPRGRRDRRTTSHRRRVACEQRSTRP